MHILKCNYTETGWEWPSESTLFHLLFTRCQRAKVFLVYEIRQTFTIATAFALIDHSAAQSANSPSHHPPCLYLTSPSSSSSLHHPPHQVSQSVFFLLKNFSGASPKIISRIFQIFSAMMIFFIVTKYGKRFLV